MSFTLCSSSAAIANAGANASSYAINTTAALNDWSDQAEGAICAECHTDFVTNHTALSTQIQNALEDVSAAKIGKSIVSYDMSGYTDRREAETILDVLDDKEMKGLKILKEKENQRFST